MTELLSIEKVVVGGTDSNITGIIEEMKNALFDECFPYCINREDAIVYWRVNEYVMNFQNPYFSIIDETDTSNYKITTTEGASLHINLLVYRADIYETQSRVGSYLINSGSSIVLVTLLNNYGGPISSYLFTGDATSLTLNILNQQNYYFMKEPKAILIPHHGAVKKIYETNEEKQILNAFLNKYQPYVAIVSAKCLALQNRKGWLHPHYTIIQRYLECPLSNFSYPHMVTSFSQSDTLQWHLDAYLPMIHTTYWSHQLFHPAFQAFDIQLDMISGNVSFYDSTIV